MVSVCPGSGIGYSVAMAATTGGGVFFGVTANAPITNLQFLANFNNLTLGLDNVNIGTQVAQTAEVAPFILIGTGLLLLRLLGRRWLRLRTS